MKISKKAEYAIRAVARIASEKQNTKLQIGEISKIESIPVKFLEQILLSLKNSGILKSKRGANGGYLLAKSCNQISIGMIIEIIDGPFDPIGLKSGNDFDVGLEKCFSDLVIMVNKYLNEFSIKKVIEIGKPKNLLEFEI